MIKKEKKSFETRSWDPEVVRKLHHERHTMHEIKDNCLRVPSLPSLDPHGRMGCWSTRDPSSSSTMPPRGLQCESHDQPL
jgi:hypothetical protein